MALGSPDSAPSSRRGWPSEEALGGDGFDVIWKSADSLIGSIQNNLIARSVNGVRIGL